MVRNKRKNNGRKKFGEAGHLSILEMTEAEQRYVRKCRRKKVVPRLGTPAVGGTWGLTKDRLLP